MAKLTVTPHIAIDESELDEQFILSSGPGGQNVNKVASAVQLRFNIAASASLPGDVRERLIRLCGSRLTKDGVLVLTARQFRSQERNRDAARERLVTLIREAAQPPKPRKATRIPISVKSRRLDRKSARAVLKRQRAKPMED